MTVTLRTLTAFVCALLSYSAHSTDYIFTGSGEWTTATNWSGGIMPSGPVMAGNTVIIRGNVSVNNVCTNCSANTLLTNGGTILIDAGATLTLQNLTQFTLIGNLIVNGTVTNKTSLEVYSGSGIMVNGTFINQKDILTKGVVTVANGGKLENQLAARFTAGAEGSLVINTGGSFANKNSAVLQVATIINNGTIDNGSVLSGTTSFKGNLNNNGSLSPGNALGDFEIAGNYTASASAMHNFEVGGMNEAEYDKLNATATVKLDGVLNVVLANGFVPNTDHDLTIIKGNIVGTFSSVFKPAKYTVVYNSNSVVLRYSVSLPMLYIKLDVKKEGGTAKLSWEIHNEPSVEHYEIERSTDGKAYQKIGAVTSTQTGKYSFVDNSPKEKNFYRIKVIDVGGTYRYSSVMSLQQGKTAIALNIFPSPAQSSITIQHATAAAGSKLLLTSVDGRIVKTMAMQTGSQQTAVDLSLMQKGMYVVQFQNGDDRTEAITFVKQ